MLGLTINWKNRDLSLPTEIRLVRALVFPIVPYGSETWIMRRVERKKIDIFEL